MKQKLFDDILDPNVIHDSLEAESIDVEENYKYISPFSVKEEAEERVSLSTAMVNKARLKAKMDNLLEPLKDEMKGFETIIKRNVNNLDQGGITTHGRVYAFAAYNDGLMGLYDENGNLVDTRPLNRSERQLHINSNLNKASNE